MKLQIKPPVATIALAILIAGAYFSFSGGALYIPDVKIQELAYSYVRLPAGILTHPLVHVGVEHLFGNIIPLLVFGALLESVVAWYDIVLLFFLSTMVASSLFSVYSAALLAGASAGIAGLMGGALALSPRKAVAFALATPFILMIALPLVAQGVGAYTAGLAQEKVAIEEGVSELVAANRTAEAAALNQSAQAVGTQISGIRAGARREALTPSDLLVHVYGAVFGVFYVFFLKRKQFKAGMKELVALGAQIAGGAKAIKAALAKRLAPKK